MQLDMFELFFCKFWPKKDHITWWMDASCWEKAHHRGAYRKGLENCLQEWSKIAAPLVPPYDKNLISFSGSQKGVVSKSVDWRMFPRPPKPLAWLPPQSLAVEKKHFVQILGSENLVEKCRWELFKRRERGLNFFGHVSDRFSDPFSRVSNHFLVPIYNFFGHNFVLQMCSTKNRNEGTKTERRTPKTRMRVQKWNDNTKNEGTFAKAHFFLQNRPFVSSRNLSGPGEIHPYREVTYLSDPCRTTPVTLQFCGASRTIVGASGGSLHGGASFEVEKARFAPWQNRVRRTAKMK